MFTVKPHTPVFQEWKFVNQERSFSGFAHVYSHAVLTRMTGWRQCMLWGWDDMLVSGERDDTDLDKGKKNLQWPRTASVTLLRGVVYKQNGNLAVEAVALRWKERQIAHSLPKAALHQAEFKSPLSEGLCQYLQVAERCFGSFDTVSPAAQWRTDRVNGGSGQKNTKSQSVSSWRAGEQGRTCIC